MDFLTAAVADKVSISDLLHKALEIVEPARPSDRLHASALTNQKGFCPREVVLMQRLKRLGYPLKTDAPMTITFHEGRDKQARLNNDWLRDYMVGNWYCRNCHKHFDFVKYPKNCCSHPVVEYREVVFHHPSGAQGSLDAILDIGKPKLRLMEFKIMGAKEWEELKAPLGEHRMRSRLYLEIIAASNHPKKDLIDVQRIHIVYCLRGYGKLDKDKGRITPFKEFVVERDTQSVDLYFNMANAVRQAREKNWEQFPVGVCESILDNRCAACCVQKECWSGKFPATIDWIGSKTDA